MLVLVALAVGLQAEAAAYHHLSRSQVLTGAFLSYQLYCALKVCISVF